MTLHLPTGVLERLAALALMDAQSEPHSSESYDGMCAFASAALAAAAEGLSMTFQESPSAKPGTGLGLAATPARDLRGDHDSPLSYVHDIARDEWIDARLYAESMAPFADGEGNRS